MVFGNTFSVGNLRPARFSGAIYLGMTQSTWPKLTPFVALIILFLTFTGQTGATPSGTSATPCELHSARQGQILNVEIGDTSTDGYNKTRKLPICSSLDRAQLFKALSAGERKLGISLRDETSEYEDSAVEVESIRKLKQAGVPIPSDLVVPSAGDVPLEWRQYIRLNLGIARVGNPAFEYKSLQIDSVDFGGYGLIRD